MKLTHDPRWVRAVHGFLDGTIISFCAWTILYEIALLTQFSARITLLIWCPLAALALVGAVWRWTREPAEPHPGSPTAADIPAGAADPTGSGRTLPRVVIPLLDAFIIATGATAAATWLVFDGGRFLWMLAPLAASALGLCARVALRPVSVAPAPTGSRDHLVALLTAVGVGVLMLFVVRGNLDDVFYVNRSVWTAEHDTFSLRDTMFGPETYPSTYAFPFASIEGLFGAMAGLIDMNAAVFSYFVASTFWCILAGWALWRLVLAWAPRRHLLVYVGALALYLFSSSGALGGYSFSRMWTGKVIALCVVLPLAWVCFTKLAERRHERRWRLVMLLLCGLAFVGMSPTGVIMAPVVSAAVVFAALLRRRTIGPMLRGAAAFAAFPVLSGIGVLLFGGATVGPVVEATPTPWEAFERTFGTDTWVVALLILGLSVGVLITRGGVPRALAAAATLATLVFMVPGMPALVDSLTGTGPVYFRLLLVPPLTLLGAAILASPVPARVAQRLRVPVVAALCLTFFVSLVAGGTFPAIDGRGKMVATPQVDITRMKTWDDAQAVAALGEDQLVLMPMWSMSALAIRTTESFAVMLRPQGFYLHALEEDAELTRQRRLLKRFIVSEAGNLPPTSQVVEALEDLEVTTVCTFTRQERHREVVRQAGFDTLEPAGRLLCQRKGADG